VQRRRLHCGGAVGGLPHDGEPGGLEDQPEPGPDELLVVGDEDAQGTGHVSGNRAVTVKPPSGAGPRVREPPQEATRSAIPARP
jgi:hypothetical protein